MTEQISTILITVLTVGGGAGAWKFYEFLIKNKREKNKEKFDDSNLYRDDLRARVEKLEGEKENLMNRFIREVPNVYGNISNPLTIEYHLPCLNRLLTKNLTDNLSPIL